MVVMSRQLDRKAVEKIYRRWAPVYDLVFGGVFERGRRAVVAASERVGRRILEVGVGTGLSLPFYSEESSVFGIDVSEEMLRKARARVRAERLRHVERLSIMDAEALDFADASFDAVVAQCVVNTVPNPELALEEFARVLRPGGEIILLNRVGAEKGSRVFMERAFQPITKQLGWRADFPWSRFDRWLANSTHDMHLVERRAVPPLGHFSVIRFKKGE